MTKSDHRPVYAQFVYQTDLQNLKEEEEVKQNLILRSVAANKIKNELKETKVLSKERIMGSRQYSN